MSKDSENIPKLAATNGTLSITADPIPNKITTKSDTLVPFNSVPIKGILSFKLSAKLKRIPRDSRAATAINIPKKNKILGISIFDKDWWTGLWCAPSVCSFACSPSTLEIENLELLKISANVATTPKESIIPTYGGRWVNVLKKGTKTIAPKPRYNIIALYLLFGFSESSSSKAISPWKAGKKDAITVGTSIHNNEGIIK